MYDQLFGPTVAFLYLSLFISPFTQTGMHTQSFLIALLITLALLWNSTFLKLTD